MVAHDHDGAPDFVASGLESQFSHMRSCTRKRPQSPAWYSVLKWAAKACAMAEMAGSRSLSSVSCLVVYLFKMKCQVE